MGKSGKLCGKIRKVSWENPESFVGKSGKFHGKIWKVCPSCGKLGCNNRYIIER